MLDPAELRTALFEAEHRAAVCGKWCRVGGDREETIYHVWHSGLGSRDTAEARIYAETILGLSLAGLTALLGAWIEAIHAGRPFDPNGGMPS